MRLGCGWLWVSSKAVCQVGCSQVCGSGTCPGQSQPGVWQEEASPFGARGEDRRHRIPWELRRAIPVPCISWAVINDLVHTLNLLQRQVQIVISKLFHFPRLCWHEAAHWAVVAQTSPATRDKPTKSLACYSKHHEIDWKIMCLLKTPCMKLLNVPIGFWMTF